MITCHLDADYLILLRLIEIQCFPFSVLCCSQSGDHQGKKLAKFGYTADM
jgi:hypothetical protein